jgi:glycosyltransferase involved in cell wall biosynthesis
VELKIMSGNESGGTDSDCAQMASVRLAQVVYALFPAGSELLAWRLAKGVSQNGDFACWMYAVDRSGPLAHVLESEGMPFRAYSRRGRLDVRLILRMAKQFRSDGIQLVHTHHLGQLLYGGVAGRLAGAKVVHTEHDFYSLQRRRLQRLLRVLSGLTNAVTGVTESVTAFLQDQVGIRPSKLRTIRNGVNLPRFRSAMSVPRSELGWGEADVVIGCVARLEPEKGHEILLEAFRLLRRRSEGVRLLLIGDGTEIRKLKDLVNSCGYGDSIRFVGLRMDIPELLATCDIVALASLNEGLPMALLEAMAAGKPVVASRVGGLPQLLGEGKYGLLVPPGDPVALADALERLVHDQARREEVGTAAQDMVSTQYAFERTVQQYRALYRSALSHAAPIAPDVETQVWLPRRPSGPGAEAAPSRIEVG